MTAAALRSAQARRQLREHKVGQDESRVRQALQERQRGRVIAILSHGEREQRPAPTSSFVPGVGRPSIQIPIVVHRFIVWTGGHAANQPVRRAFPTGMAGASSVRPR